MEKEKLKRIFEFLEEKENLNPPFLWKHKNNIPITKDDLIIDGDLHLENSTITSLPDGLEVEGHLDLSYCKHLTSLPKGLKVGRYLWLAETNITSLPEGLIVKGGLEIAGTPLEKYSNRQLREMVKPGFIDGSIVRD